MKRNYDAMIARCEAAGKTELADALREERDARALAAEVSASECETDRLLQSAARGLTWGSWNN